MISATGPSLPDLLRFGRCELRVAGRELLLDGKLQALPPKVFELLLYLVHHRGRVVSKGELLVQLWGAPTYRTT